MLRRSCYCFRFPSINSAHSAAHSLASTCSQSVVNFPVQRLSPKSLASFCYFQLLDKQCPPSFIMKSALIASALVAYAVAGPVTKRFTIQSEDASTVGASDASILTYALVLEVLLNHDPATGSASNNRFGLAFGKCLLSWRSGEYHPDSVLTGWI
jgi:hypothetical protein